MVCVFRFDSVAVVAVAGSCAAGVTGGAVDSAAAAPAGASTISALAKAAAQMQPTFRGAKTLVSFRAILGT
jgi:hypothetical protein